MPAELIVTKIIDPFQYLMNSHKKQMKSQNLVDEHFKDCKFKPSVLKHS